MSRANCSSRRRTLWVRYELHGKPGCARSSNSYGNMSDTTIKQLRARRVWDSRGRPTVEAEVRLACNALGRAIAPAGASRGSRDAQDLRDGGPRLGGMNVHRAVVNVNGAIAQALVGLDALDQQRVDETLIVLDATP